MRNKFAIYLHNQANKGLFDTIYYMATSFGKKLRECRDAKGISQNGFSKLIEVHHSIIGKYERDEVKPSIDVVKKIADALDTTVGYLLGEAKNTIALKDQAMLKRINDINTLPDKDKECILYAIDGLIKSAKFKAL